MSKHINEGFEEAQRYAAEHRAPDLDKMIDKIGNPTWRDHARFYKKGIVNGVTFIGSLNLANFLPANLAWIAAVVALVGWAVGVQVENGPKPPVKDKTGWVAAATPPKSDAIMPTEDVMVTAPSPAQPAMSAEQAALEVATEDDQEAHKPDE